MPGLGVLFDDSEDSAATLRSAAAAARLPRVPRSRRETAAALSPGSLFEGSSELPRAETPSRRTRLASPSSRPPAVQDSAASGGYYIACAADEIVADANSIVGSIGVISRGFGFVKSLKKKGVERRVHAAGDSKSGERPRPTNQSIYIAPRNRRGLG